MEKNEIDYRDKIVLILEPDFLDSSLSDALKSIFAILNI